MVWKMPFLLAAWVGLEPTIPCFRGRCLTIWPPGNTGVSYPINQYTATHLQPQEKRLVMYNAVMDAPNITTLLRSLPPRTRQAVEELARTDPDLFSRWCDLYEQKQAAAAAQDDAALAAIFEEEKQLLNATDE